MKIHAIKIEKFYAKYFTSKSLLEHYISSFSIEKLVSLTLSISHITQSYEGNIVNIVLHTMPFIRVFGKSAFKIFSFQATEAFHFHANISRSNSQFYSIRVRVNSGNFHVKFHFSYILNKNYHSNKFNLIIRIERIASNIIETYFQNLRIITIPTN